MKLRTFIFVILLSLLGLQFVLGQEKPKAILQDEFSPTNCCDLSARTHNLILAIQSEKASSGLIILDYTKDTIHKVLYFERVILAQLFYAKINNVKIIRQPTSDKFKIQFWFVPQNGEIPFQTEDKIDFSLVKITKKRRFAQDDDALCSTKGIEKHFAEIVLANPNLSVSLVINAKSRSEYLKKQKSLLDDFVNIYQIPKSKISFFYVKNEYEFVEYWFIPKRKNSQSIKLKNAVRQ